MAASEVAPFAKTGGLGRRRRPRSPRYLASAGHDVRLFLPLLREPEGARPAVHAGGLPAATCRSASATGRTRSRSSPTTLPGTDLPSTSSCARRSTAATPPTPPTPTSTCASPCSRARRSSRASAWASRPTSFHVHDWHTALVPALPEDALRLGPALRRHATVLTIHNIGVPGHGRGRRAPRAGPRRRLAACSTRTTSPAGRLSFLTTGLLYADALTTVSRDLRAGDADPEYGMGLDPLLRARARLVRRHRQRDRHGDLVARDRSATSPARYSADDLSGKARCKRALLDEVGLAPAPDAPRARHRLAHDRAEGLRPRLRGPAPGCSRTPRCASSCSGSGDAGTEAFFRGLARALSRQGRASARATTTRSRTGSRRAPTSS